MGSESNEPLDFDDLAAADEIRRLEAVIADLKIKCLAATARADSVTTECRLVGEDLHRLRTEWIRAAKGFDEVADALKVKAKWMETVKP